MVAFTEDICIRKTRIFGTLGELECVDGKSIRLFDFKKGKAEMIPFDITINSRMSGHNGADWHLMHSFIQAVALKDPRLVLSGPDETLESHLIVFAAEQARRTSSVIQL